MKLILIIFSLVCCFNYTFGQTLTVENNRQSVVLHFSERSLTDSEQNYFRIGNNYKFYELVDPKGINIRAVPLENIAVNQVNVLQNGFRLQLNLNSALEYGKIYLLKINNAKFDGKELAVLRVELSQEPTLKVFNDPRNKMRLESNVELNDSEVKVEKANLKISSDNQKLEIVPNSVAVDVQKVTPTQLNLNFKKELDEGRNHYFRVNLKSDDGTNLKAKGKIFVPGLPTAPIDPIINLRLSSEFGGNFKPQFNLAGYVTKVVAKSDNNLFYFEPILSVDLGLGNTKARNNIFLELPTLKTTLDLPRKEGCKIKSAPVLRSNSADDSDNSKISEVQNDEVPLPCYAEWKSRNPLSLYSVDFKVGAKFETDKRFSRVNALGTARFDFNFDRWQHSVLNQRSYLALDLSNTPYKNSFDDVQIKTGFTITPRIGFEFGKKLTTEIVENKTKSIRYEIGQNPIFRSYFGFASVFEFNYKPFPIKLSLTQDVYYLALSETSGEIRSNLLVLRRIKGFHPLGRASIDIALDPAKRYNFNISYENGRSAPNFEYLNVVRTGFRIVY